MSDVDVIIVGAGISGLSAARLLEKQGLTVLILEATARVGGKAETLAPGGGKFGTCDTNSGYVTMWQLHAIRMCRELGLELYEASYDLYGVHWGTKRVDLHGDVKPMIWLRDPLAAWEITLMVRRLERMCWEVPFMNPWEAPRAREWDGMTVQDFYDKYCWTQGCHEYMVTISSIDVGSSPTSTSLLFYLWYLRHAQGPCHTWAQVDGADAMKIRGGAQAIPDGIARELKGDIKLNEAVVQLCYGCDGVSVTTLNGNKYKSKYAILATSPATQMKIHFDPPLSAERSCLLQRAPHGLVMVGIVFYREPFWQAQGLSGFATCSDPEMTVSLVFEDHQQGEEFYNLTCFAFGERMLRLSTMGDSQRQEVICQCLAKFYNSEKALKPDKFVSKVWSDEQYSLGGYATSYSPGTLTLCGSSLREPLGTPTPRVFMAGVDTSTHWVGFMSGAIDAGERAAREILHEEGRIEKSQIFIQHPSLRYKLTFFEENIPEISTVISTVLALVFILGAVYLLTAF